VIALNLENDRICVYRGEQRTAQSVDDLREVIDEDMPAPNAIRSEEWRSLAAGRAQVYSFLAAIYNRAIDERLLDNLGANSLRFIGSLEKENDLTGDLNEGLGALERFRLEAASRPREVVEAELAEEYTRLFQGGKPKDGLVSACEATYTSLETHGLDSIGRALDRVYAQGGFCLSTSPRLQPDFIGCELDFMQHLCSKECAAWTKDDRDEALHYQAQQCAFLKDHLIRWVPRLCDVVLMQTKLDFYRGIMCVTKGFILNEAYRVVELMESDCPVEVTIAG
jgi:TorA maturation chaperone TorD